MEMPEPMIMPVTAAVSWFVPAGLSALMVIFFLVLVIGLFILWKVKSSRRTKVKKIAITNEATISPYSEPPTAPGKAAGIYQFGPEFETPSYSYTEAVEMDSVIRTRRELGAGSEYLDYECPACGAAVEANATSCPVCHEVFGNSEIVEYECPTCGAKLDESMSVCPDCGERFDEGTVRQDMEMSYECPFCHDIVDPGLDQCPSCGRAYIDAPEEGDEVIEYECPTCGARLPDGAVECPDCGEKFDE